MGLLENIVTSFLDQGIIIHKSRLSPGAYHIRIQNVSLKNQKYSPGDFLRVHVGANNPDLAFSEKIRSYSVWNIDTTKGELDIALTTHGGGPGANFAVNSKVGDRFYYRWHSGKFTVDRLAVTSVFVGDLSTLSQFYEFKRYLGDKNIHSFIYTPKSDEFFPDLDGSTPFQFYQLPEHPADTITKKLEAIRPSLDKDFTIYIAGDSRLCVSLTQHLRNTWKLKSQQIKSKPYWNPLKKGLE